MLSHRIPGRVIQIAAALLLAASTLAVPRPVFAQDGVPNRVVPTPRMTAGSVDQVMARKFEMGVGKSIIVDLPRDAKEVFVGNPAIANAVVRSARKIFVIGVANGSTSIFALDGEGRQIAALEIQVGREPGMLGQLLRAALPHAQINAASIGDSIVLTGTVDTVLEAQKAVDIAKGFLGVSSVGTSVIEGKVINSITVRGKDQVMLKVTVAEVQRTTLKQLGVNLNGTWEVAGKTFGGVVDNPFTTSSTALSQTALRAGAQLGTANQKLIDIRALERQGVMRLLAEPTLTAISGETAKFTAGGEIPVPRQAGEEEPNAIGQTLGFQRRQSIQVEWRPYGVQLNFTPVVLSEGRISLAVNTEVTEIDSENGIALTPSIRAPGFRVRKAMTTVELPSGGQLVTAGLIQQVSRQTINGLPGLMNIPILGQLFRSRDYLRQETELMMIVTPFIARPSAPKALARPDDGFSDATDPATILMGRLNRVYGAAGAPRPPVNYRGRVGFIHD
jgi:pilus assembly protein CpaC